MKLHHIGLAVSNVMHFVEFWCEGLGFVEQPTKFASRDRLGASFGVFSHDHVSVLTYAHPDSGLTLEMHLLPPHFESKSFDTVGVNHLAIHTGAKGSREKVLEKLPTWAYASRYQNPKGWENIVVTDWDGNKVELYEDL
jgi:catechol 2,3-dioxygenase-like lactoylglutathione lyase family enzyme